MGGEVVDAGERKIAHNRWFLWQRYERMVVGEKTRCFLIPLNKFDILLNI